MSPEAHCGTLPLQLLCHSPHCEKKSPIHPHHHPFFTMYPVSPSRERQTSLLSRDRLLQITRVLGLTGISEAPLWGNAAPAAQAFRAEQNRCTSPQLPLRRGLPGGGWPLAPGQEEGHHAPQGQGPREAPQSRWA